MSQINEKFHLTNWEIVSVNPVDKNWNWRDYFCFWANNVQSLISFSLIAYQITLQTLVYYLPNYHTNVLIFYIIIVMALINQQIEDKTEDV